MTEDNGAITKENLLDFFADYSAAHGSHLSALDLTQRLSVFFQAMPLLVSAARRVETPVPAASDLSAFFDLLQVPLKAERECGGFLNLWSIAGLNGYEVRTAGALAGLWHYGFGGNVSRSFVGSYLGRIIPERNWQEELRQGYNVYTEVNPLGDVADRVDLLVETDLSLVGVEIKIKAGLGERQLERYAQALEARASYTGKCPFLILLAPYGAPDPRIYSSTWRDVAAAARSATLCSSEGRTIANHIIAEFGDHVSNY